MHHKNGWTGFVYVCVKMRLKPILYSNNSNKIFEHSFDLIFRDQNIHDYKPTIDVKCRVLSFRLVIEHAKMGFNYQLSNLLSFSLSTKTIYPTRVFRWSVHCFEIWYKFKGFRFKPPHALSIMRFSRCLMNKEWNNLSKEWNIRFLHWQYIEPNKTLGSWVGCGHTKWFIELMVLDF